MALARGRSSLRTGPLTLHTKTAIHIAELITGVSSELAVCVVYGTAQMQHLLHTILKKNLLKRVWQPFCKSLGEWQPFC